MSVVAKLRKGDTIAIVVEAKTKEDAKTLAEATMKDIVAAGNLGPTYPEYTPDEFLDSEYDAAYDIQDGGLPLIKVAAGDKSDAAAILARNYRSLVAQNSTATWIVYSSAVGRGSSYWTPTDKGDAHIIKPPKAPLVVIRSTFFYLANQSFAYEIGTSILVCSAPYVGSDNTAYFPSRENALGTNDDAITVFYKRALDLISFFVAKHNESDQNGALKIKRVAIPYLGLRKIDDVDLNQQDALDKTAALWNAAVIALKTNLTKMKIDLLLMCGRKLPWVAPSIVKAGFAGKLLLPFPDCIGEDEPSDGCIKQGDVASTMFVCDREYGKRVGNDNDEKTTGGVFGMYVPMHFTASEFTRGYNNKNQVLAVLTMPDQ
jgi:hypothetical protein